MKKLLSLFAVGLLSLTVLSGCSSEGETVETVDLNALTLEEIIANAKEEGVINSIAMPDTWANWVGTWDDIEEVYGIKQNDVDMTSAEELALFEAEGKNGTKDIGDVGQSFGPLAESKGLTAQYKTSYWDEIPDWAKDDDGDWIIAYYGTMAIITNKDLVDVAPTSFADILEGDYKVTVGDVVKGTSGQCILLSAAMAYGGDETNIEPGLEYFKQLAEQGRIDLGEASLARLEKGEIEVMLLWDYNALNYRDQIVSNNPNASYEVTIPTDGAAQSGYATVINKYAPNIHAAALAREYILSDEGQINLAIGYATPIRDVELPTEVAEKRIPTEQYANAKPIANQAAWEATVAEIGVLWQEEVMAYAN